MTNATNADAGMLDNVAIISNTFFVDPSQNDRVILLHMTSVYVSTVWLFFSDQD